MWAGYKVGLSPRGYSAQASCLIRWMPHQMDGGSQTQSGPHLQGDLIAQKIHREGGPLGFVRMLNHIMKNAEALGSVHQLMVSTSWGVVLHVLHLA